MSTTHLQLPFKFAPCRDFLALRWVEFQTPFDLTQLNFSSGSLRLSFRQTIPRCVDAIHFCTTSFFQTTYKHAVLCRLGFKIDLIRDRNTTKSVFVRRIGITMHCLEVNLCTKMFLTFFGI